MTNIENRDEFTMQELHEAELNDLYDDLMAVLERAYEQREFIDDADMASVMSDVIEDFSVVLP
jgi:hypothetical protein